MCLFIFRIHYSFLYLLYPCEYASSVGEVAKVEMGRKIASTARSYKRRKIADVIFLDLGSGLWL